MRVRVLAVLAASLVAACGSSTATPDPVVPATDPAAAFVGTYSGTFVVTSLRNQTYSQPGQVVLSNPATGIVRASLDWLCNAPGVSINLIPHLSTPDHALATQDANCRINLPCGTGNLATLTDIEAIRTSDGRGVQVTSAVLVNGCSEMGPTSYNITFTFDGTKP